MILPLLKLGTHALKTLSKPIAARLKKEGRRHPKFRTLIICFAQGVREMGRPATTKDAQALLHSLRSAYAATPPNLKIIDIYIVFVIVTALIQVVYMAIVGLFPFNSFLSGVLSCIGAAVLAVSLQVEVNKENKEFKDLPT